MSKIKLKSKLIVNFCLIFFFYFLIDIALRRQHGPNNNSSKTLIRGEIWQKLNSRRHRLERVKYDVDCHGILEMNPYAIDAAVRLNNQASKSFIADESFHFDKSDEENCANFREKRGFDSIPVTQFEKEFSLAFTIMTYDKAEQFER